MITELRYNARGTIDCILEHPKYGKIPYTLVENDLEPTGQALWAKVQNGDYGPIAPYEEEEDANV